jgi:hypothetical protein
MSITRGMLNPTNLSFTSSATRMSVGQAIETCPREAIGSLGGWAIITSNFRAYNGIDARYTFANDSGFPMIG